MQGRMDHVSHEYHTSPYNTLQYDSLNPCVDTHDKGSYVWIRAALYKTQVLLLSKWFSFVFCASEHHPLFYPLQQRCQRPINIWNMLKKHFECLKEHLTFPHNIQASLEIDSSGKYWWLMTDMTIIFIIFGNGVSFACCKQCYGLKCSVIMSFLYWLWLIDNEGDIPQ